MIDFTTRVFCDRCYESVDVEEDIDTATRDLENKGWLLNSNRYAVGLDLCPECAKDPEADP